jgi:GNAT superfamily N-acetyltransferase
MVEISLLHFLTGADSVLRVPTIDLCFEKTLEQILAEAVTDDSEALAVISNVVIQKQAFGLYDIVTEPVNAGAIMRLKENKIIGAYLYGDLVVDPAYRQRGLGADLVANYYRQYLCFPCWQQDKPGFTPAGLACHKKAWRILFEV